MTLSYIRPDADDTDGTWTNESDSGSNLFASIDETSANDSDYIKSAHLPDHDICKIRLSDPSGLMMRPATVHYRFKKRGETTQQINLDVSLLQGSTEIAKWSETDIATSYVDGSQALTVAQFNSISDFTNLYLQFDAFSSWWLANSEVDLWFEENEYHLSTALSSAHLLLHCDGADASTTFIDATGRHQVTAVGGAQIDTAQSKFGGASALFNGSSTYLNIDGSSDFAFGTGDFTIDFWFRLSTISITNPIVDFRVSSPSVAPVIFIDGGNNINYDVNGTSRITGGTAISVNTWYHLALTRSGTSTKLFLNGTQEGSTYTASDSLLCGSSGPFFGGFISLSAYLSGWLDEIRILKGTAAWTTTFTPPTAPYNVALSGPYAHLSCSRASIGYATTSSGTLTSFAANALRITDLGLLVEDARTNVCLESQTFLSTGTWNAESQAGTTTTDAIAAPDGTTTADLIDDSDASNLKYWSQSLGALTVASYTFSIYAKAGTSSILRTDLDAGGTGQSAFFQLSGAGSTVLKTVGGAASSSIEALANGWYRCTIVVTGSSGGSNTLRILPASRVDMTGGGDVGSLTGNLYVWGAQLELGTFPSSYIPTTSSAATRADDDISVIGNLNTLLTALPQSAVIDLISTNSVFSDQKQIIGDTDATPGLGFSTSNTGWWSGGSYISGPVFTIGNSLTWALGAKAGFAQNSGSISVVAGGGTVATDTTQTVFGSGAKLGTSTSIHKAESYIRRATFWNSKLADATLQTLTDPAHTTNFTTDAATIDLDFANAAYNAITLPTDFLICSRASVGYAKTVAGTLQQFGANQLRITDLGLLVEDARENKAFPSVPNSTDWSLGDVTFTANDTTAPDGTTTATKITDAITTAQHYAYTNADGTSTTTFTASCFLKNGTRTYAKLAIRDRVTDDKVYVVADLSNGTITDSGVQTVGGSGWTLTATSIEAYTTGWYRVIVSGTHSATTTRAVEINPSNTSTGAPASYLGNGSTIWAWGAQLELASFASSFIPTTSAAATRAADAVKCIGNLYTLLSAAARTYVVDLTTNVSAASLPQTAILGDDVSVGKELMTSGSDSILYASGGVLTLNFVSSGKLFSTGVKVATAISGTAHTIDAAGLAVASDSAGALLTGNIYLGTDSGNVLFSYFRRATFWNSKLADATLQGFTNP